MEQTLEGKKQLNIDKGVDFLRRRGIWIALCVLVAGIAAFAISKAQQKQYTASSAVIFNEDQLTQEIAGLPTTATNALLQHASNLELLDLGNMAARTAAKVGNGLTERDVASAVKIEGDTESNIASITATDPSPELAAQIATVYAKEFVKQQGQANSGYYESALALVRKQIAGLKPGQRNSGIGIDLFARAHSLELLSSLQPNSVEVVQAAEVPAAPSSPTTTKNTLIGIVLGFFLGLGIALLIERADPRLRGAGELAKVYGTQLLGTVPRSPRVAQYRLGAGGPTRSEADAFQVIRAQLGSFNPGQVPSSVLVSSAVAGEGKSTIAFHLAGAAAQTGLQVLLIEADLRRPSLAKRLDIDRAPTLLEATIAPRAVEHAARVAVEAHDGQGSLAVLPAGDIGEGAPPSVIDSEAMDRVLALAATSFDLVIVDGPELTGISDAFFLLGKIDGLILVGVDGRSRRDVAEDLDSRLRAARTRVFGVVANRVGRSRGRRRATAAPAPVFTPLPGAGRSDGAIASEAQLRA
jgi:polysaccharide biosynthesis transport protein